MKHLTSILVTLNLLLCISCNGQTKKELIVGDWVEVRRETRLGYVYNPGGAINEPSLEFSFGSDGFGTLTNPNTGDDKAKTDYVFIGDSVLVFWRINEIVQLDKQNLVLILRSSNKFESDLDLKCHFIRRAAYDKLSKVEIENLKAPTQKDIVYQDSCLKAKEKLRNPEIKQDYYQFVEVMPSFPGGPDSLKTFIRQNLKWQEIFGEIEGTVFVSFIVETDGSLTNFEIKKELHPACDKEALRVIQSMPNWIAGQQNGKYVRVKINVPVRFQIE